MEWQNVKSPLDRQREKFDELQARAATLVKAPRATKITAKYTVNGWDVSMYENVEHQLCALGLPSREH